MMFVEDKLINQIKEEVKEWPRLAYLKNIFTRESELYLDLSYLNTNELKNYVGVDSLHN